jgi:hypothetical protein
MKGTARKITTGVEEAISRDSTGVVAALQGGSLRGEVQAMGSSGWLRIDEMNAFS